MPGHRDKTPGKMETPNGVPALHEPFQVDEAFHRHRVQRDIYAFDYLVAFCPNGGRPAMGDNRSMPHVGRIRGYINRTPFNRIKRPPRLSILLLNESRLEEILHYEGNFRALSGLKKYGSSTNVVITSPPEMPSKRGYGRIYAGLCLETKRGFSCVSKILGNRIAPVIENCIEVSLYEKVSRQVPQGTEGYFIINDINHLRSPFDISKLMEVVPISVWPFKLGICKPHLRFIDADSSPPLKWYSI